MKVSIVIPTLDAGAGFEELLRGISAQEGDFEREIVVVDSGSTDGTVELARRHGATVHEIERREFDHGATRNLGISLAGGEYVALIVQDAVPVDVRWLAAMVENLERDALVAGVYSRQIPRPESSALARVVVNTLPTAGTERREQFAGPPGRRERPPQERLALATFDNVSSCLRRSVWEDLPFERASFGEDLRWGNRAITAGYKLVYEPRSAVFHSHERGVAYDLRRGYAHQLLILELFGLRRVPNLLRLLLGSAASFLHVLYLLHRAGKPKGGRRLRLGDELRFAALALQHALPVQLGAYLGGKSGALARTLPRFHRSMHQFLSKGI